MMDLSTIIIETERLLLLPLDLQYAESIFKEFTPEITKYMLPKSPDKVDETMAYIKSMRPEIEKGAELPLVILDRHTKEFLGGTGAHKLRTRTPQVGIWIKKSAHSRKYGREAVYGVIEWIKKNIEYDHIAYPVDKRNIASRKIPESLGGVIAAEHKILNGSGFLLDEVEYRIYTDPETSSG